LLNDDRLLLADLFRLAAMQLVEALVPSMTQFRLDLLQATADLVAAVAALRLAAAVIGISDDGSWGRGRWRSRIGARQTRRKQQNSSVHWE
jgi:hypothetical protein